MRSFDALPIARKGWGVTLVLRHCKALLRPRPRVRSLYSTTAAFHDQLSFCPKTQNSFFCERNMAQWGPWGSGCAGMPFRTVADAGNSRTQRFNTGTPTDVRGISQPNVHVRGTIIRFGIFFLADNTPTRPKWRYGRNCATLAHKVLDVQSKKKWGTCQPFDSVGVHVILFRSKFGIQYAKYRRGTYPAPFRAGWRYP